MPCTATAIAVADDLPRERWETALRWLGTVERGRQWWIGDLLVHGGKRYGETYDAAIEATGLALSTLKAYKRVASKYEGIAAALARQDPAQRLEAAKRDMSDAIRAERRALRARREARALGRLNRPAQVSSEDG